MIFKLSIVTETKIKIMIDAYKSLAVYKRKKMHSFLSKDICFNTCNFNFYLHPVYLYLILKLGQHLQEIVLCVEFGINLCMHLLIYEKSCVFYTTNTFSFT